MASSSLTQLRPRLERLSSEGGSCCSVEYPALFRQVRDSPGFRPRLARLRALSDMRRFAIVAMLERAGEMCACEIQAALGVTHPTVSHHMNVLRAAGLVNARPDGKWVRYRLRRPGRWRFP